MKLDPTKDAESWTGCSATRGRGCRSATADQSVDVSDEVSPDNRTMATRSAKSEAFSDVAKTVTWLAKAESLITHCPGAPGQVATQNFGYGFRPNWVGSRRPLRRSRSDAPCLLETATTSWAPRVGQRSSQKDKNPKLLQSKGSKRSFSAIRDSHKRFIPFGDTQLSQAHRSCFRWICFALPSLHVLL